MEYYKYDLKQWKQYENKIYLNVMGCDDLDQIPLY
jgi:hypothetical protein